MIICLRVVLTFCHKREDRVQFGIFRILYIDVFDQVFEEEQITG